MNDFTSTGEHSLSSSDESLSLHCDLLTESLFDEKSLLTFFNDREQKHFKNRVIRSVLADHNVKTLSALGMSNFGFVTASFRRECWYLILSEQLSLGEKNEGEQTGFHIKEHKDEAQVRLDVNRSFTTVEDKCRKDSLRRLLEHIIVRMLRKYPKLNYYQGYHDVVSVFIVVFMEGHEYHPPAAQLEDNLCSSDMTSKGDDDIPATLFEDFSNSASSESTELYDGDMTSKSNVAEDKLFRCVEAFTMLYLRDFMMDSLDFPIDQLKIIPQFIKSNDKLLYRQLQLDKVEPFFAVSSILTIFSHEMKPLENHPDLQIFQIFDFVISSQSMVVPLIMYSVLIMENKAKLLSEYNENIDNFENTVDLVHGIMQQVLITASLDEQVWKKILDKVRSRSSKEFILKYKGMVNKYSTLLTTASGEEVKTSYDLNHVVDLLEKEIEQNTKRKVIKSHRKIQKTRLLLRLFSYAENRTLPFICKVSVLIGLLALFVKFYRDGTMKTFFPVARTYMRKFHNSYIAGLYQGSKYVWLDPLHELLKHPLSPTSTSLSSTALPSSVNS